VRFEGLAPPTREELQRMVERVAKKTLALVQRRGLLDDEPRDALSLAQADSLQKALPVAMELPRHKLAGFLGGFSLEAGSHIEASDLIQTGRGSSKWCGTCCGRRWRTRACASSPTVGSN
jgi:hypothetical protein